MGRKSRQLDSVTKCGKFLPLWWNLEGLFSFWQNIVNRLEYRKNKENLTISDKNGTFILVMYKQFLQNNCILILSTTPLTDQKSMTNRIRHLTIKLKEKRKVRMKTSLLNLLIGQHSQNNFLVVAKTAKIHQFLPNFGDIFVLFARPHFSTIVIRGLDLLNNFRDPHVQQHKTFYDTTEFFVSFLKKLSQSRPLFLYVCLFNTVDSKYFSYSKVFQWLDLN